MNIDYTTLRNKSTPKEQWNRCDAIDSVINFEQVKKEKIQSQRQFAKETGIPRSTLQHWIERKKSLKASPVLIDFFESSEGLAFIHQLLTAVHFVFTKDSLASIHSVSRFIELSGLSPFVASSYSTGRLISKAMDDAIIEFGEIEQQRLCKTMRRKKITLAEDETFHPETCLVSIEPESNYIIAEKYTENRKGETWTQLIKDSIKGLPVEIIQISSDEGTGLINHTTKGLNAHHSPDCFHVPHEIGKGTSGALAARIKKAQKASEKSTKQVDKIVKKIHQCVGRHGKNKANRYKELEAQLNDAVKKEQDELIHFENTQKEQKIVQIAKAEIGVVYHPYDLKTGEKQTSKMVSTLLEDCFERINDATMDLSQRCKDRVAKAKRVVSKMTATITFFFNMVAIYLENSTFSEDEKEQIETILIPGYYLQAVARREKNKEKRNKISKQADDILLKFNQKKAPFLNHSEDKIEEMRKAARECVQFFQRSSSCVEGRNAQLSLRHHGLHRLSDRCLKAQTVVHNYYRTNKEKETPAERFFEAKHEELFKFLLEKMDYPVRPRVRKKKAA